MKTYIPRVLMVMAMALATVPVFASAAVAHDLVSHDATCSAISATFANFPDAPFNAIDVHADGNTVTTGFEGSSGPITVPWSQAGVITANGGVHTYSFSWTADGGGSAGPFSFDADANDCVPPPTPVEKYVCRDGKTVHLVIPPDSMLPGDMEGECPPPPPEKIVVCRNGALIEINKPDRLPTDTDACMITPQKPPVKVVVTPPAPPAPPVAATPVPVNARFTG